MRCAIRGYRVILSAATRPCALSVRAASIPTLTNRGGNMWGKHSTQSGLVGLILVGMLAGSGCTEGKDTKRVEEVQTSVAETSASIPASATADSANSPIEASPREPVDVASAEPPADEKPTKEPVTSVEEPPAPTETPARTERPAPTETATPAPPTEPSPPKDEVAPDAAEGDTTSEGKLVAVADTKSGLTRIGATKCKMCHKVQYASWADSKHAALTPPLDCESCHGSGSEYKKKSIMEDPEMARAAGLVMPGKAFCGSCHQDDWQDDMLERSHAHKEDDAG